MNAMNSVKKSITLAKPLDRWVVAKAKSKAKARGEATINYSAAIADLVIEAHQREAGSIKRAA